MVSLSAATTTSAAAVSAVTTVSTPEATATATTATTTATRTLLSDIDAQRATLEILTIEVVDRLLSALGRCHLDEAEAARLTGHPVEHQSDFLDLTTRCKLLVDQVLGGVEGKVTDVKTIRHVRTFLSGGLRTRQTSPTAARRAKSSIALNDDVVSV
jgi:hypothetical protein